MGFLSLVSPSAVLPDGDDFADVVAFPPALAAFSESPVVLTLVNPSTNPRVYCRCTAILLVSKTGVDHKHRCQPPLGLGLGLDHKHRCQPPNPTRYQIVAS